MAGYTDFLTLPAEGKSHKQALIPLARRRMNVIWAMLRDHMPYIEPVPAEPIAG